MPTEPTQADLDRFVAANVHLCLSSLVSTLAKAYGSTMPDNDAGDSLGGLVEQAFELCRPIEDYEEAARQAGFLQSDAEHGAIGTKEALDSGDIDATHETWQECCEANGIDPYEWEIFEHWAVSEWFAEQLEAKGERVDRDFAGMCVWGRTTTGQSIAMDSVVAAIWRETHKEEG